MISKVQSNPSAKTFRQRVKGTQKVRQTISSTLQTLKECCKQLFSKLSGGKSRRVRFKQTGE